MPSCLWLSGNEEWGTVTWENPHLSSWLSGIAKLLITRVGLFTLQLSLAGCPYLSPFFDANYAPTPLYPWFLALHPAVSIMPSASSSIKLKVLQFDGDLFWGIISVTGKQGGKPNFWSSNTRLLNVGAHCSLLLLSSLSISMRSPQHVIWHCSY